MEHNEMVKFMKEFGIDILNRFDELIIDEKTNTYAYIGGCEDFDDVKTRVVFSLCRPISKGLGEKDADRLLERFNKYFGKNLTKDDMLLMYQKLCYPSKIGVFKDFIKRDFPLDELKRAV
ncbi:hypothetical protein LCM23_13000 [Cytobacillus kochii]|uniref:hypothetical protein n=1 Tax=Cytobacillus kochii TaxID=859143 RepID=UPI001CD6413D|nr:hypothetical protein [Cytobacillus kochii]MCA1027012.1 hypothetical protein [Cytobacillus kochii]